MSSSTRNAPVGAVWREQLLRSSEQALEDLAVAQTAEVVFVRAEGESVASGYADEVEERALAQGFVTAQIGVATERSFESMGALVRAVLLALRVPGPRTGRGRGVLELLDAFASRNGRKALALFDEGVEVTGAVGDLVALARAYVAAASQPSRTQKKRLLAWLEGTELARAEDSPLAMSALTERTAKRALAQVTHLMRVLGHRGTLLVFRNGETLLRLPPARRETAYTVLRELVDNADGGHGLYATRIVLIGTTALFQGTRSLASLKPLATRVAALPGSPLLTPPHRPLIDLMMPASFDIDTPPTPAPPDPSHDAELRGIIRACHGLPPVESILSMSVGQESIDRTIDQLFEHSLMDSSVFALLTGEYGSGKTHLLLHLAARALAEKRPVFRLSLERLDTDLGNPQRHLRRVLETSILPGKRRAAAVDRLTAWTRDPQTLERLTGALEAIAELQGDTGTTAQRALARAKGAKARGAALEAFLGAADLVDKPGGANYRQDAYGRLLVWVELLERLEGCAGPVVLIDEAENLYKMGISRSERRTALRSLSFYCGGTLPRACVVMAITPDVLDQLRNESQELLDEVSAQSTVLDAEDATMLRRRLVRLKPISVPALGREHRATLLGRVYATHTRVRARRPDATWGQYAETLLARDELTPRELVRYAAEWLESSWWSRKPRKG
ncbi:DUF2791 family P-loop domain-containing protein [Pendulispora rubella]|uniref:DUF2791 family P-loop domain-containing protein n=1 Tax=Pendulispora rubella TaxID=2741070 RepID=A0ABZ2KZA3_9BACT